MVFLSSTRCPDINVNRTSITSFHVKWSRYRPGVAQRVGRGIASLFHDRGTRRGWVVSSTPWPDFTPGKDPVPILQEAGWAPRPVWTGGRSRPHRDSIPDRPVRSQSLYRLSYPAHIWHVLQQDNIHVGYECFTFKELICTVGSRFATVRFTTIHSYDPLSSRTEHCRLTVHHCRN